MNTSGAEKQVIVPSKYGTWNEEDRLEMVRLLAKAGYAVRIGKRKKAGQNVNEIFVEYWRVD